MRNVLFAAFLTLSACSVASAAELGRPTVENAYVFTDETAYRTAIEAFQNQQMSVVLAQVVCIVPRGTYADIVSRPSMLTREIVVMEGPKMGCRGVVPVEDVR